MILLLLRETKAEPRLSVITMISSKLTTYVPFKDENGNYVHSNLLCV